MSFLGPEPLVYYFAADPALCARKLARERRSAAAADAVTQMLEWAVDSGTNVPADLFDAMRKQMGIPIVPGLPPRLRKDLDTYLEAVAREALALALDIMSGVESVPAFREVLEQRLELKAWAIPLDRLRYALDPDPDHDCRSTIGHWREEVREYTGAVGKVACETCRLLLPEDIPGTPAVARGILIDFVKGVLRGNPDGERLLAAVGVGSTAEPTLRQAAQLAIPRDTKPPLRVRAA